MPQRRRPIVSRDRLQNPISGSFDSLSICIVNGQTVIDNTSRSDKFLSVNEIPGLARSTSLAFFVYQVHLLKITLQRAE